MRLPWLPSLWTLALLALIATPAPAQYDPFRFERYGVEDGLTNQIVTSSLRDSTGYLWVGTPAGLNRYDGYAFKAFLADAQAPGALRDAAITTLFEDHRGNLWVGTKNGGLHLFDAASERFTAYQYDPENPNSLTQGQIKCLFESSHGLWVGTTGGLNLLNWEGTIPAELRVTRFRHGDHDPSTLSSDRVQTIAEDAHGKIWVGTRVGLNRLESLDRPVFTRFLADASKPWSIPDDEVYALRLDSRGDMWLGVWGNGGLARLSREQQASADPVFQRFPYDPRKGTGFPRKIVIDILEDSHGDVWICGGDDGILWRLDKSQRDSPTPAFLGFGYDPGDPYSLGAGSVISIREDMEGLLWIATSEGGLCKLDLRRSAFRLYRSHPGNVPGLPEGVADTVVEDRDGTIWVGTGAALCHITPAQLPYAQPEFSVYEKGKSGLSDGSIATILLDTRGQLWVGMINGGVHVRRGTGGRFHFENVSGDPRRGKALGNDTVLCMFQDSQKTLWAGTYQGVYYAADAESGRPSFVSAGATFAGAEHLDKQTIEAVAEAPDGSIWVGTLAGVTRLDTVTRTAATFLRNAGAGLPADNVTTMLASSKGVVWIGTRGGLCKVPRGSKEIVGVEPASPLARASISSIVEGVDGKLWVGTTDGLYCHDPVSGEVVKYGRMDGFPADLCYRSASSRGASGRIYVGTQQGLVAFLPSEIASSPFMPNVVLTELLLSNRVQPILAGSVLPAQLGHLDEVTLRHTDNLVTFEFAALELGRPLGVQYAYMMEGLVDGWVETDATNRRATFTNLPAGRYIFRVKARGANGAWNNQGASIVVTVLPPWWRSWWAYMAYLLFIASAAYIGYRMRIASLTRKRIELEALVEQRTAELAASERRALKAQDEALEATRSKSRFLANMSHELRTPLNAILGFAQLLARSRAISGEDRENVSIIQRSGTHLLDLINDVLSISKIEAGKVTLVERPYQPAQLLEAVRHIIRPRAVGKGIELIIEGAEELPRQVVGDEGKLRQVLINLLGNAVKFTDQGHVRLRTSWRDDRATFEVEDTGEGISEQELPQLFEAFVQTQSGRAARDGTGLGLVISRQIARLMGGDITVSSQVGIGSVFRLEVSLPRDHGELQHVDERRVVGLAPGVTPPRLLVVDDTDENRLLLCRLLGGIGFPVREAVNGAQALEVWQAWHPALVWMDVRMPVMDGREATRRIRQLEATSPGQERTVIIALTASVLEHEREAVLADGTDGFVAKPFKEEAIFETLATHLGVKYVYEDTLAGGVAAGLQVGRFEDIPPALVAELERAAELGDDASAMSVVERIREYDDGLANDLAAALRGFDFDRVLAAIRPPVGGSQ